MINAPTDFAVSSITRGVRTHQDFVFRNEPVAKSARSAELECPSSLDENELFTFEALIRHRGNNPAEGVFLEATTTGVLTIEDLRSEKGTVSPITPDTFRVDIGSLNNESVAVEIDLRPATSGRSTFQIRLGQSGSADFIESCEITVFGVIRVDGTIELESGASLTISEFVEVRLVGDSPNLVLNDGAEIDGDGVIGFTEGMPTIFLGNPDNGDGGPHSAKVRNMRIDNGVTVEVRDAGRNLADGSSLIITNRLELTSGNLDMDENDLVLEAEPTANTGVFVGDGSTISGSGSLVINVLAAKDGGFPNTLHGAFSIAGTGNVNMAFDKISDAGVILGLEEIGSGAFSFNRAGALFMTDVRTVNGSLRQVGSARTEFHKLNTIASNLEIEGPGGEVFPDSSHSDPTGGVCDPDVANGNDSGFYFFSSVEIGLDIILQQSDDPATEGCVEGITLLQGAASIDIDGDVTIASGPTGISGPPAASKSAPDLEVRISGDLFVNVGTDGLFLGQNLELEMADESALLIISHLDEIRGPGKITFNGGGQAELRLVGSTTERHVFINNLEVVNETTVSLTSAIITSPENISTLTIGNRLVVDSARLNMAALELILRAKRTVDAEVRISKESEITGVGSLIIDVLSAESGGFPNTMAGAFRISGGGVLNMNFDKISGAGVQLDVVAGGTGTSINRAGTLFLMDPGVFAGSFQHQSALGARTEFHGPTRISGDLEIFGPGKEVSPDSTHADFNGRNCDPFPANGNDSGVYFFQPVKIVGDLLMIDTDDQTTEGCVEGLSLVADSLGLDHPDSSSFGKSHRIEAFSIVEGRFTSKRDQRPSGIHSRYSARAGAFHNLRLNGSLDLPSRFSFEMDLSDDSWNLDPADLDCKTPLQSAPGNKLRLGGSREQSIFLADELAIGRLEITNSSGIPVAIDAKSAPLSIVHSLDLVGTRLVTNGLLDMNGTGTVVIHSSPSAGSGLSKGDAPSVYVSNDRQNAPLRVVYRGSVDRTTGDELEDRIDQLEIATCGEEATVKLIRALTVDTELRLTSGPLSIESAQLTLGNGAQVSIGDGALVGSDQPPPKGSLVFPTQTLDPFTPGEDGIDLLYFGTTDRTVGLEWPPSETDLDDRGTDADVIRNVEVNPNHLTEPSKADDILTISLRDDDRAYRINGALSISENATLDLAGNLLDVDQAAFAQFIHNTAGIGPVNIAVDGKLLLEGLSYRASSGYLPVQVGSVDVDLFSTEDGSLLFSQTWSIENGKSYVGLVEGLLSDPAKPLNLEQVPSRQVAGNPARVEFIISNGSPDAGPVDVRTLDPNNGNLPLAVLAENLSFGQQTGFLALPPGVHTIDVVSSTDGSVFEAYRFDFSGLAGKTLTFVVSGSPFVDDLTGFTLLVVDAAGAPVESKIVTAISDERELPTDFVLHGNYPNPFSETTTVLFDLPRPAHIQLELVDILGRTVMRFDRGSVPAGHGHTVLIDASNLGPGTYFYRLTADDTESTPARKGRLVVVK